MALTMLDYALRYRRRGFSVIPCKKDKRPHIKWEMYQLQKPSEDEIRQWWGKWPDANIAIACGPVSGVDVLDVDSEEAWLNLQENYPIETLQTPQSKTPKGRHLYFKHQSGLSNAVRVVPGTDLRTQGGYVIAPPSKNGGGTPYYWFEGLGPKDCEFAEWPSELFAALQQGGNALSYNNIVINTRGVVKGGDVLETTNTNPQNATTSTNSHNLFIEGQRDNDLFHVANCMARGGCEKHYIEQTLEILAKNCIPPFDTKEIPAKINSALQRKKLHPGKLSEEVREFVLSTNGHINATDIHKALQIATKEDLKNVSMILARMKAEGLIEKAGVRNGEWRLVEQECQPMDWINADCSYKELWLPLALGEVCGVQPGNILVFAGAKDSGKTAFLLNSAKENRHKYKIHYFNSEMGAAEFKMRVSKFSDVSVNQWKDVSVYERSENFADVIKPGEGNLNIIDFLEVVDEFWKVASSIQKIHKKLDGALALIAIQKNPKADLGRGGAFSLEKARLYVSLDWNTAKIISCKNFKENEVIKGNPRGYTCNYKLFNGCEIHKQHPGWTSPNQEGVLP